MKNYITSLGIALCLHSIDLKAQSVQDLDFLIGSWEVRETIYPGTDKEYIESGERTCEYFLETFIKCQAKTVVEKSGRKREYAYFINYNDRGGYFAATNIASDFPIHGQHRWFLNAAKDTITFVSPRDVNDRQFFRGTIVHTKDDQLIWEGWNSPYAGEREWNRLIREVATRK